MEILKELGYTYIENKKTYIELRTSKFGEHERIKIIKDTLEVYKDCKTRQGNKGHRSIKYDELLGIIEIIEMIKNKECFN